MAKITPATRGITRKRIRLMPIASSAAISWPTCMLPNSVQMAVPDRQITMNAVRSGPSSRTNVSSMILARKAPAPTCGNVVPAWMMMMRPSINAIAPTTGSASTPVNRIWRVMTRNTSPRPRRAGEKSSRKARRPRTRTAAANSRPSSVFLPVQAITPGAERAYPLGTFCFSQSARNFFKPTSVSGCWTSCLKTANGMVQMSPPILGLHHVLRMAYAGHQHLRLEVVVPVDGHDVPDEPHAVLADVVQPPNEGTDAPGAGLGGQEGLARRETQRDVDLDPFRRQC